MATFQSGGYSIAYDDVPGDKGRPMILVHGFTSNRNEGWLRLGWYGAFERQRIRCVALDNRGHGESAKPHEPEAYSRDAMSNDILNLMDHLGIERAHIMGYSMGSRLAIAAAMKAPKRFATLTIGGVGDKMFENRDVAGNPMAEAMEATDIESIKEPMLKSFRQFADEQGEDRLALAAMTRNRDTQLTREELGQVTVPTLVVAGSRDDLAGDPHALAREFPDGRAVVLPGCDHFSAIPHALYKATVFDFLDGTLP